jgi:1-acyl-sn-glycerol-3-phosphate acyltransferase
MLYQLLRAAAGVGLRWYYADIVVQGADRIPARGPLIVAANHPNALVDALVVSTTVPRRVRLTAKATLFEHALLAPLLRAVGVVPLRRAQDQRSAARAHAAPVARNADAFALVVEALCAGGAVLVFPEGISHDEPDLAPLKTGAARMALAAHAAGATGLVILPVGLVFEEKERPRSRLLVRIGTPIALDAWCAERRTAGPADAARLTVDVDAALRRVTLNFASEARAQRAVGVARALAAIAETPPALGRARSLATEAELARRVDAATDALAHAPPDVARQADAFIRRVEALESRLGARQATLADVQVSPRIRHGAWFVVREGTIAALGLPVALLGQVTHWVPLRLGRWLAMRPLAHDRSRDQPAMRTIVFGVALVPVWYLALGILVAHWLGATAALLWLAAIFLAAGTDFVLRDRMRRARQRARTYLALRADPTLRLEALDEIRALLADALALERALVGVADAAR